MRSRDSSQLLFYKYDMFGVLDGQKRTVAKGIDGLAEARILNTPPDALTSELVEQFRINVPQLDEAAITVSPPREIEMDVSGDFRRSSNGGGPTYIKAIEVTFRVPFSGDKVLFEVRPTHSNLSPPRAYVSSSALEISFREIELAGDKIRKDFDAQVADIKGWLKWQENDAKPFNDGLPTLVNQLLTARRENLQRTHAAVSSFGFPVRG